MQDINIGQTIARERRAVGITQDDLAAHLGVTKAAVSKWELGQSLPDVALLPRIAAYFRLTLDQLFDYRPQLSTQEVGELYLSLMEQFACDPEAAYQRAEEAVAGYYSCWPLLLQAASLYLWRTAVEPERKDELATRALELLSRVEEHGDDVDAVLGAKILHGSILSLLGDVDGAIELMESLRPKRMVPIDDMLASLYEQKGDGDASLRIQQESLFWGSTNAMGSIVSQLHQVGDAERAEALLRAGEGMLAGFEFERTNPTIAIMFWGNAARACAGIGDAARAASYADRFARALEDFDADAMVGAPQLPLYDKIPGVEEPDASTLRMARIQFGSADLPAQLRDYALGGQAWEGVADDPRIKPLLDRLAAL